MFTIPQSEECLIGGILIRPEILAQVRAELEPADFEDKRQRAVYQTYLDIADNREEILPAAIAGSFTQYNMPKNFDVNKYLADILVNIHTSAGWRYHVEQIKKHKLKRALLEISGEITAKAETQDSRDILADIKMRISDIEFKAKENLTELVSLSDALPGVIESLEKHENLEITTGLCDLDALIGGWKKGDFIILAGRPGMGKSVLAKDFAEAAKVPVLYFSLEMPVNQLIRRQLASRADVNYARIRQNRISDDDWPKIIKGAHKLERISLMYNDNSNISIDDLAAMCEAWKRERELGMVVIDYLQLIRTAHRVEYREAEVALISQKLKRLARSLDIPVICLAQLNRSCETRGGDKKPLLSDLRESGSLEQDADTVVFIWRESVYKKSAPKHEAWLLIGKSRNTETGKVEVYFDGSRQIFRNLKMR